MLHDESETLGSHEYSRDVIAAVETVYPGVIEIAERGLKQDTPKVTEPPIAEKDREAQRKLTIPEPVINAYIQAHKDFASSRPTTDMTLQDINVDGWKVSGTLPDPMTAKEGVILAFPASGVDEAVQKELTAAWLETPTGMNLKHHKAFQEAEQKAREACAGGATKEMAYPKGEVRDGGVEKQMPDSTKIAAIVGGVIAALLTIAGVIAALPMLKLV